MINKDLSKYGYNTSKPVYVIAEIGINHNGDVNQALELVNSAAKQVVMPSNSKLILQKKSTKREMMFLILLKNVN